jgi:uncharacterized paraquat-inducible protein A
MNTLRVKWHCCFFVGKPYWHNDTYEPRECETEFETSEDQEIWNEKGCTAICPKCGALLTQTDDAPEIINGITSTLENNL